MGRTSRAATVARIGVMPLLRSGCSLFPTEKSRNSDLEFVVCAQMSQMRACIPDRLPEVTNVILVYVLCRCVLLCVS